MSRRRVTALETFRDEIARALRGVKAYDLPAACLRLGLAPGSEEEAFRSKHKYVRVRLVNFDDQQLLELSREILKEYEAPSLEDFVSEFTTPSEQRVSDLTRREILKELDNVDVLFGDVPVWDGLGTLTPNWSEPSKYQLSWSATIHDDVEKHYLQNPDLSHSAVLELCGVLVCAQQRFFNLLEKLVDPTCRRGDSQSQLVSALNNLLAADGYLLAVAGLVSRHARYEVRRIAAGVAGTPKNLIFAAVKAKPDLYFTDAINNDVAIVNRSDALIYDRPLSDDGLKWEELAEWWKVETGATDINVARQRLFVRLRDAVLAARSPGEYAIFSTYYRHFNHKFGDRLPALIPQVYLHYDPRSSIERGGSKVLVRQRMDFLLLLPHGVRVVVEVDGSHHYGDNGRTAPAKYAEMTHEDRRLRLIGYEVYRFGAAEFTEVCPNSKGRYDVGTEASQVAIRFFDQLFDRHPIGLT